MNIWEIIFGVAIIINIASLILRVNDLEKKEK